MGWIGLDIVSPVDVLNVGRPSKSPHEKKRTRTSGLLDEYSAKRIKVGGAGTGSTFITKRVKWARSPMVHAGLCAVFKRKIRAIDPDSTCRVSPFPHCTLFSLQEAAAYATYPRYEVLQAPPPRQEVHGVAEVEGLQPVSGDILQACPKDLRIHITVTCACTLPWSHSRIHLPSRPIPATDLDSRRRGTPAACACSESLWLRHDLVYLLAEAAAYDSPQGNAAVPMAQQPSGWGRFLCCLLGDCDSA